MIVSQAIIVPRSGWRPGRLLRVGSLVATTGFLLLLVDAGMAWFFISMLVMALGLGIAAPGYVAGPTLFMKPDEQGSLAGLLGATNGLTFVVAPTLSTVLYGVWQPLPVIVGAGIAAAVFVFVSLHPMFKKNPVAARVQELV